jgi:hypothetical protein
MLSVGLCACAHDPEDAICPPTGAGDLVITEISGEGEATQWIEVYNAAGELDPRVRSSRCSASTARSTSA